MRYSCSSTQGRRVRIKRRTIGALAVLALLLAFVGLSRWYGPTRSAPVLNAKRLTVRVVAGTDSGPGSLREALFAADAAPTGASVLIEVDRIALESALPPIVNSHGLEIVGPSAGVELDAHAIAAGGAVLDIDAENAAVSRVSIRHCAGAAVLVRARRFHLTDSSIEGCDVGVEVAGNASEVALERNQFNGNRLGVRFSAASRNSEVVRNEFSGSTDAALWLVASQSNGTADAAVNVHDNQFNGDRAGVVLGNVAALLEHNDFTAMREAAVHVVGEGAVVRTNRVLSGAAAGFVVENASGVLIEDNDLTHLDGYGILMRGAANGLLRGNRIHSCAYGLAFVLGVPQKPSTATDNTLIDLKYDGIDVVGDSPVLKGNQVLQARVAPLHVQDFTQPNGQTVHSQPLLDKNSFQAAATARASEAPSAASQ
jgi:parallel beta-helix repeat protein